MRNYPTISQYNQAIIKFKASAFKTLQNLDFIPSRTTPIEAYLFGAGVHAVVYKARIEQDYFAIRCFLFSNEIVLNRSREISQFLKTINVPWKVDFELYEEELKIGAAYYPIVKMDWVEGLTINKFVSKFLHDNVVLEKLQFKLIELNKSLEKHKISHGNLDVGNIIVEEWKDDFNLFVFID